MFTWATAMLFRIGRRSREGVGQILRDAFRNWAISNDHDAYGELDQRLRCLARINRKAFL